MFWLNIFDILGTIAFATSGALVGIRKKLDLFGIITLSITTASFGGLSRDIFMGNIPPTLFTEPKYFAFSSIAAVVIFLIYPKLMHLTSLPKSKFLTSIFLFVDAIGLGAFTALGAKMAIANNLNNLFSVMVMGLITGVGGGVIRDLLVGDIPLILRKDIYASAALAGTLVMYFSYGHVADLTALYFGFLTTVLLRLVSIIFKLNLPTVKIALPEPYSSNESVTLSLKE